MDQKLSGELLAAFRAVDFDWTRQLQSVWRDWTYHVEGMHQSVANDLMSEFLDRTRALEAAPLGWVIAGPAGSGKTHLIGSLRQKTWAAGGWFVLLDLVDVRDFWSSAALGFVSSLQRPMPDEGSQYEAILKRITADLPVSSDIAAVVGSLGQRSAVTGPELVAGIIGPLRQKYPQETAQHYDVVRALMLLGSLDWSAADVAFCWLQGQEIDDDVRRKFGFSRAQVKASELVRGMSWVMSLAGPTLIAVDQIDAIVSIYNLRSGTEAGPTEENERQALSIIEALAGGLMELHDIKHRALTVVSCLEATWNILKDKATKSAPDRFHDVRLLKEIPNSQIADLLIRNRLQAAYAARNFSPPYPTWPFRPESFETAVNFLPRQILKRCEEHRQRCLSEGKVIELASFAAVAPPLAPETSDIDRRFAELVGAARIKDLLDPEKEDRVFCDLLLDVLRAYARQADGSENIDITVDGDLDQRRPSLHGRLRFCYRDEGDREQHYCFRAIGSTHALAVQARMRAAMTAAGLDEALKYRQLVVLRRPPMPRGRVTDELVAKLRKAGGQILAPSDDDLRVFLAVQMLLHEAPEGLDDWLRSRKPLCNTSVFQAVGLCGDAPVSPAAPVGNAPAAEIAAASSRAPTVQQSASGQSFIPVGQMTSGVAEGGAAQVPTAMLCRHTAILAGSGSGKTVLLRRIIEEAALLGIPAIVLDTNNDLARLGDPWPQRPSAWTDEDQAKAAAYGSTVEVVVWTPGLLGGNPIVLSPLPDFAPVRDDPDELAKAVEMARATLLPFIGATGLKGKLKEGLLADALRAFALKDPCALRDFIAYLDDLPENTSDIVDARKLGAEIANQLRASIAVNPLLASSGSRLDPAALLTASAGGKTRISVINFSGLPSDESRQAFVNQLEMALFTWIKRNPAPQGRPLNGLFVMDEAQNFAPAQQSTPCKGTTLSLVAQSRKYGLGMIFATQAPKGIDNKIIGNCTTQFYGKMNAPATIDAARELMSAKGGAADDIGKLGAGQFYFYTEGLDRPTRVATPLCLSFHPANPLSEEEVARRARDSRDATAK